MNSLNKERDEHDRTNTESARKPYSTPQVKIYGDLREITQTAMNAGMSDGGEPSSNRFTH